MSKWIAMFIFLFGVLTHAERRHVIELSGFVADPSLKQLTVDSLKKDFPRLSSIKTEWRTEGKQEFQGVLFQNLVKKYAGPGVTKAKVTATNAYSQDLSSKDWDDWGALLAFQEKGEIIPTKNKGTFRIVYDYQKFDEKPAVKSMLENNSVWQVVKIEFLK
ncbi:MAG: hypothetical protein ACXWC9_03550 [Pseudobdellovibrionaceae bacterium]